MSFVTQSSGVNMEVHSSWPKLWLSLREAPAAESSFSGGNSHWRCVTYIQQLQMHLFCSGAASALLLSLFPLFIFSSDAPSLPAATHLVHLDLSRPTTLGAALPVCLLLLAFFFSLLHSSISCLTLLLFSMCRRETGAQTNIHVFFYIL